MKKEKQVQTIILSWYSNNKRDLPWRHTTDPYKILVSELMLQQTQVSRVIEKYNQFLKRFSTIYHLARARQSSVVKEWKGLGYNNRAVRLHKLAKLVVAEHNGTLPMTREQLEQLPGIGPYTAGAVLSFAHNKDETIIDTNIRRVLERIFHDEKKTIEELVTLTLPTGKSREWHNALMDIGATICVQQKPKCEECPLNKQCDYYKKGLHLKEQEKITTQGTFIYSNRYWRAKIVDYLRTHKTATEKEITKHLKTYKKDAPNSTTIIPQLEKDGLLKKKGEKYVLL